MEIKINLPESFEVTARKGASVVPVDIKKLSADIIAKAVLHGLKQKIADGAANATMNATLAVTGNKREGEADKAFQARLAEAAKTLDLDAVNMEATRLMLKVRDTLESGSWGVERGEAGPEVDLAPIAYAMTVYTAKLKADIAGYADMKMPERRKAVDAWLDAKEGRRAVIVAKVAEEKALAADI
jgi:hypothetical protein